MGRHNREERLKMWQAMLKKRSFTVTTIARAANAEYQRTFRFVEALRIGGFLQARDTPARNARKSGRPLKARIYTMPADAGRIPPAIKANGDLLQPTGRDRMWKAMPALKRFSHADLALVAAVKKSAAWHYCLALRNAGYLRVVEKAQNVAEVYLLDPDKFTGPLAPHIRRDKSVYDLNTGKVAWQPKRRTA